jgi:archaellum biogenesis ATPase FlaH
MESFLYHKEKKIYVFKFPIKVLLDLGERYVVVLDISSGEGSNDNIYCINKEGQLLWQIEKRELWHKHNSYQHVVWKNNELTAYSPNLEFKVDINTGIILGVEFAK